MFWYKSWKQFNRQHCEVAIKRVLQNCTLANPRKQRYHFGILKLIYVNCLIHLSQSDCNSLPSTLKPSHCTSKCRNTSSSMRLKDIIIDHLEVICKLYPKVTLPLNIILHVNQPIYFNVDCKPIAGKLS